MQKVNADLESGLARRFNKDVAKAMRIVEKEEREAAFGKLTRRRSDDARAKTTPIQSDARRSDSLQRLRKIVKAMEEDELRVMVVDEKIRPDGRKPDEIRPIWSKVHFVPRVHGSGVFTRGQTQVFTAATLGSISDAQRLDGIVALEDKRYMHFYNFPPFSVGETRPMRGPGPPRDRSRRTSRNARFVPCCRRKKSFRTRFA